MDLPERSRSRLLAAALVAAAVAGLAFANSLANDFAYDDHLIIAGNEAIHSLGTLPGTFWKPFWPGQHGRELGLWRPVATLVYGLQWMLWQGDATGFHVVNVLLNSIASGLVVLLLGHLLPVRPAFLAGLLFAVHPVHVEAVANVVGMAEILAACLYLGACLVVVAHPGRMRPRPLLTTIALFLCAALVKEGAITLPAVVFLLDCARRDIGVRESRGYLRDRGPLYGGLALAVAAVFAGRLAVLGSVADPFPPLGAEVLASGSVPRIWTVLVTWPQVFRLLLLPLDLSADYAPGLIPIAYGWTLEGALGLAMGLGALGIAWAAWRTGVLHPGRPGARAVGFGIIWFFVTSLPTSNLLFLTGILLAERTLYLPSVGFVAAIAWILSGLERERPWAGRAATLAIVVLLLCRTIERNPTWRDNSTVFTTLIHEHPESGRAQWMIGDLHFADGDDAEGLAAYRRAIGLLGGSYALMSEIGLNLYSAGLDQAAEHVLHSAWELRPDMGRAPALLALLHHRQGRWTLAEQAVRAALRAEPENPLLRHVLARSLEGQGHHREALDARATAIEPRPEDLSPGSRHGPNKRLSQGYVK